MRIFLLLSTLFVTFGLSAQAVFEVISPDSIKGFYTIGLGDSTVHYWGNGDISKKTVQADLMLATGADSLAGTTMVGDYTGKIAVVHRGTYGFSQKALNAQLAGAVGVIIINHGQDNSTVFTMSGTLQNETGANATGLQVKIPVVMIDKNDGKKISDVLRAQATVNGLIGKKRQLDNDLA